MTYGSSSSYLCLLFALNVLLFVRTRTNYIINPHICTLSENLGVMIRHST